MSDTPKPGPEDLDAGDGRPPISRPAQDLTVALPVALPAPAQTQDPAQSDVARRSPAAARSSTTPQALQRPENALVAGAGGGPALAQALQGSARNSQGSTPNRGRAGERGVGHDDPPRDARQRLRVLRDSCAHLNPSDGRDARALHGALADALELELMSGIHGSGRRSLIVERARALQIAGRGDEAGRLYESLGELTRAARAYVEAGCLEEFEFVEAALAARARQSRSLIDSNRELAELDHQGQRRQLRSALAAEIEKITARMNGTTPPSADEVLRELAPNAVHAELTGRLRVLQAKLNALTLRSLDSNRMGLRYREARASDQSHLLQVCFSGTLRVGRAPDLEVQLDHPSISRHHLTIAQRVGDDGTSLVTVRDHGSRSGSFWDTEALEPDAEYELAPGTHTISLGERSEIAVHVTQGSAVVVSAHAANVHHALPARSGHLCFPTLALDHPLRMGLRIHAQDGEIRISSDLDEIELYLRDHLVSAGVGIWPLDGDRLRCTHPRGGALELEVTR